MSFKSLWAASIAASRERTNCQYVLLMSSQMYSIKYVVLVRLAVSIVVITHSFFVSGTRRIGWVISSTRVQSYNKKPYFQNFLFNFSKNFHFFLIRPQESARNPVYLHRKPIKTNSYARSKSSRRLSVRNHRQSLSNKGPSGSPSPRNLRIRVQGEARANKKEIGNNRILSEIPYLCCVLLPRIAFGIGPPRPGFVRGAVFPLLTVQIFV